MPRRARAQRDGAEAFYDFHLEVGSGPIVNPLPLDRSRRAGRAHAHHNPMQPYRHERGGLYRPRVPTRVPRSITDEQFNEIFTRLPSNRDRALVAFYVAVAPAFTRSGRGQAVSAGDAARAVRYRAVVTTRLQRTEVAPPVRLRREAPEAAWAAARRT